MIRFAPAALAALLLPAAARAETPPAPLTVELELADKAPERAADTLALTLALDDRHCSSVSSSRSNLSYKIDVCREGGSADTPILHVTVERNEHRERTVETSVQKLKVTARVAPGRRVILGRLTHGDGAQTELAARLR
jgi:hypothetical protein